MANRYINSDEIRKAISLLKKPGDVFEIRGIAGKEVMSAYFTDVDTAISELSKQNLQGRNVYIIFNHIAPALYSRKQRDHFESSKYGNKLNTTMDDNILSYEWLLIDVDPERPSDVSSSSDELEAAKNTAARIKDYLNKKGFSDPIIAMSGNGYHIAYKVDYPNNEENRQTTKDVLKVLDLLFSDDKAKVDTSVCSPAQPCKLWGTLAQKGSDTGERPHRMSRILKEPEEIRTNDISLLEALAGDLPVDDEPYMSGNRNSSSAFDVREFLTSHGVEYREVSGKGYTKLILKECIFNPDHIDPEAAVFVYDNGTIGYHCFHNSCAGYHWRDARLKLDPAAYDRTITDKAGSNDNNRKLSTVKNGIICPAESKGSHIAHLNPISAYELDAVEMPPINWIVKNLIARGNVIIFGAPSKYFKSYLVLGQMAAISEGKSYLGFESSQCECLYFDLESTRRRPKERLNQILGANHEKPKGLHIITGADNTVGYIGKGFEEQLSEVLNDNPKIGLVAIDVFGKIRTTKGKQDQYEYDYKDVTALKTIANKYDVAIILVHHTTKMKRSDPFDAITGSVGLVGAVDCAWTITKDNRAATEGVFHVTGRDIDTMEISVRFNKDTFTWERLGTAEEMEYKQLMSDYEKSNIVKTVFALLVIPGTWDGSTEDLINASFINNTPISEDARVVGLELARFKGLLEIEGITFSKQRNSKGVRYAFTRRMERE